MARSLAGSAAPAAPDSIIWTMPSPFGSQTNVETAKVIFCGCMLLIIFVALELRRRRRLTQHPHDEPQWPQPSYYIESSNCCSSPSLGLSRGHAALRLATPLHSCAASLGSTPVLPPMHATSKVRKFVPSRALASGNAGPPAAGWRGGSKPLRPASHAMRAVVGSTGRSTSTRSTTKERPSRFKGGRLIRGPDRLGMGPDFQAVRDYLMKDQRRRLSDAAGLSIEEKERLDDLEDAAEDIDGEVDTDSVVQVTAEASEVLAKQASARVEAAANAHDGFGESAVAVESMVDEDPLWGVLLHKEGNRRLYLSSIDTLKTIPVWDQQRSYRKARARKMADDKLKQANEGKAVRFPGVISVYERAWEPPLPDLETLLADPVALTEARKRFGVIDGQHRVGAMRLLKEKGMFSGSVLVEVFALDSEEEAEQMFKDINKAEPVKDVDLPGAASDAQRMILDTAVAALARQFPDFFKDSQKCRRPHLNVDNLRDDLFQLNVLDRHGLTSHGELVDWLIDVNERLAARSDDEWLQLNESQAFSKALTKSRSKGFFLGLDSAWLEA